jgi:hypothetical protein
MGDKNFLQSDAGHDIILGYATVAVCPVPFEGLGQMSVDAQSAI